ncbi:TetR family transcriptional regulator C-terminal domain-containing protein [Microtetraspora malaysiensis]|uniref:TetR family transcriptional regulator C-terminal domain-containing protein n=1 Tax=Microtetraspora malaysiensis TaxID=161358 RepID=UPI000A07B43C|nr:TetR family transcriptional regulator C-terminal domain-containing protein [Microtetraspora malaysiensis]
MPALRRAGREPWRCRAAGGAGRRVEPTTRPDRRRAPRLRSGTVRPRDCRSTGARHADRLARDADVEVEARRLCALLDGLSLQAVLHPASLNADSMLAILHRHLTALISEGSG